MYIIIIVCKLVAKEYCAIYTNVSIFDLIVNKNHMCHRNRTSILRLIWKLIVM